MQIRYKVLFHNESLEVNYSYYFKVLMLKETTLEIKLMDPTRVLYQVEAYINLILTNFALSIPEITDVKKV